MKQKKVQQRATKLNGSSAGQLPNQVRRKKLETKDQNTKREMGEKLKPLNKRRELEIVKTKRKRTENNRARTPPSLFGIERRMAQAKRKYHSGWMWVGVTRGFAGMKFSASIKTQPYLRVKTMKTKKKRKKTNVSLTE